jgi:hypothetical protein
VVVVVLEVDVEVVVETVTAVDVAAASPGREVSAPKTVPARFEAMA